MKIGVIGGTGLYQLEGVSDAAIEVVHTPYGQVEVVSAVHAGRELAFLARHGTGHTVPPHRVNYRANVDALRRLGCRCIVATNAVGSMRREMAPGDLVLPDQFLDFTKGRPATFHEGAQFGVRHVDVTEPYCPALRRWALEAASKARQKAHEMATYVCTEGPRFETPAEIRMFERLGGDVVGMTGVPEVVLAREAGLCYVSLCVVTNYAAGISPEPLTAEEVMLLMQERLPAVREVVLRLVEVLSEGWECGCQAASQS